jgi:class 3 adenylate cyclase
VLTRPRRPAADGPCFSDVMHDLAADREPSTATFLFADIAGFTALTEAHGDEQAAMVVARFCEAVTRELPAFGATHVKTIGDALMLRIPDPAQAVLLGLRIAHDPVSYTQIRAHET